jgi:mono/diheme cytochrome c family protein
MSLLQRHWFFGSVTFVTGFLLLVGWSNVLYAQQPTPPPYDPATIPIPAQPPVASLGRTTYAENCAPCHGAAGNSDGPSTSGLPKPPPKFSDPATIWPRSPAEYFHIIKFGRIQNLMPPWGQRLTDEQIWQAAYYAWSLHTDQAQVQQGAELYSQSCASCHGPSGAGDGAAAQGELPDWRDAARMGILTQAELEQKWQAAHADQGANWNDTQRRQILDYLRTCSYIPPWESAYRPGNGQLQGQVVQGSAGGGAVAALPITLTAYINFQPTASFTTTADDTGNFQFENLATGEGIVYIAETVYAALAYNSELVQLHPLTPTQAITLPVYETTTDGSGVQIDRANWLIDAEPGALRVGVIMFVGNRLDRTYIGSPVDGLAQPATLAIQVPTGATEIQFEDGVLGGRYQQVGERIYDIAPIWPGEGERRVVYSYRLPFTGDSVTVEQSFLYQVGSLSLLVTELPNLAVTVDQLTAQGAQTVQGINFRVWSGQNLATPHLRVVLQGLPPAGSPDPRATNAETGDNQPPAGATVTTPPLQPAVPLTVGGVLTVVLTGLIFWPLRQQFGQEQRAALLRQRTTLVQEIAALDDRHAAGQLPTTQWTAERAQLKTTLLAVARELGK